MKNFKKIFLTLTLVFSSMVLLTGCGLFVNKKAEAVKGVKASLEGVAQGNKKAYEDYYGSGKYDERINDELNRAGFDTPEKKKNFKMAQSLLNKVKLSYEEKSDTEVIVHFHPVKLDENVLREWATKKMEAGTVTQSNLNDSIISAINSGEIKFSEEAEVTKTAKCKEEKGKYEMTDASAEEIIKAMIVQ